MSEASSILHSSILEQAHRFFLQNKFIQAAEIYQIIIDSHSPSQDHQCSLTASTEHRHGYYGHLSSKELLNITNNSAYSALSICFLLGKDQKKAIKYYSQKSKIFPKNSAFRVGLAVSLQNIGQRAKATIEWQSIATQQYLNKNTGLRELALSKFSQGNYDGCQDYLQLLPKQMNDLSIKAIQIYLSKQEKRSVKMSLLIQQNKQAYKLYVFLAKIYEQQGSLQKSKQTYMQCITLMQNQGHFYEAPFILLSKISKNQSSMDFIEKLLLKYPNDCIFNLFSTIKIINNNDYDRLEDKLKISKLSLNKNGYFPLKEENRSFLLAILNEIQTNLIDYRYFKLNLSKMPSVLTLTQLYSYFQQNPDINLTVLRIRNPLLFKFLYIVNEGKKEGISQFLFDLYQQNENNLQLINLYASQTILTGIDNHQFSLQKICEQLKIVLDQSFTVKRQIIHYEMIDESHEDLQIKLKVKKSQPNPFKSNDIPIYFLNCYHLYTCVKKICKKISEAQVNIKDCISLLSTKENINMIKNSISYKIEPNNQLACINQVIQQLLPEIQQKKRYFMQELQKQISSSQRKIPNLIKIMLKKWEALVTQTLRTRQLQKKQIECSITDWIQIEIILPSQIKIVACINEIKSWCSTNDYKIVKLDDNLKRDNQIGVSIAIKDIICTFVLITYRKLKEKRFKQSIKAITNPNKNMVFNVFLNVTKKYQFSIMSYLQGITKQLINSQDQRQREYGGQVQNFTEKIEYSGQWLTTQRLREILSSFGKRRQSKRVLTEVSQSFILNEQSIQTDLNQTEMSCLQSNRKKGRARRYSQKQMNSSGKSRDEKQEYNVADKKKILEKSDFLEGKGVNQLQCSGNDDQDFFGDPRISQIFKSKPLKSPRNRLQLMAGKRLASVNSFQQMILEDSNFEEVGVQQQQNIMTAKLKQRQEKLIERYIDEIGEKQEIIQKLQKKCEQLEQYINVKHQDSLQLEDKVKNIEQMRAQQQSLRVQNKQLKVMIEEYTEIQYQIGKQLQASTQSLEEKSIIVSQIKAQLSMQRQQKNRLVFQMQLLERQKQQLHKQQYNKQAQATLLREQLKDQQISYNDQIKTLQRSYQAQIDKRQREINEIRKAQNELILVIKQMEQKNKRESFILRSSEQTIQNLRQALQSEKQQRNKLEQKNKILLSITNEANDKIREDKQIQQRLNIRIQQMIKQQKQRQKNDKQQQKIIQKLKEQANKLHQQLSKLKCKTTKTSSYQAPLHKQANIVGNVEQNDTKITKAPKKLSKTTQYQQIQQQKDQNASNASQQSNTLQIQSQQSIIVQSLTQQLHQSRRKQQYLVIFFTVIIFQAITITLLSRFIF